MRFGLHFIFIRYCSIYRHILSSLPSNMVFTYPHIQCSAFCIYRLNISWNGFYKSPNWYIYFSSNVVFMFPKMHTYLSSYMVFILWEKLSHISLHMNFTVLQTWLSPFFRYGLCLSSDMLFCFPCVSSYSIYACNLSSDSVFIIPQGVFHFIKQGHHILLDEFFQFLSSWTSSF
jgi:hypothetical protein